MLDPLGSSRRSSSRSRVLATGAALTAAATCAVAVLGGRGGAELGLGSKVAAASSVAAAQWGQLLAQREIWDEGTWDTPRE